MDVFYNSLGGLLGYQHKCLEIMLDKQRQGQSDSTDCSSPTSDATFHMPQGPNLAGPNGRQLAAQSAAAGLEALPHMAEIYPLGGAPAQHIPVSAAAIAAHCTNAHSCYIEQLLVDYTGHKA